MEGTHEGLAAARLLGVSRSTIYKYVPELATGRPAVEQPTARAELEAGS
ncbi:hypothetical protein [Nonomuraea sp. NPDC003709]